MMFLLSKYFEEYIKDKIAVVTSDKYGVDVDAVRGDRVRLLANETINESPANVPHATGATQQTILGKIAL